MSAKYSGPDDWTIFHIADDRQAYSLKNSATERPSSSEKKKDDKERPRSDKQASSSSKPKKKKPSSAK